MRLPNQKTKPSAAQRMLGLLTGMPMAQGLGILARRARVGNVASMTRAQCFIHRQPCPAGTEQCVLGYKGHFEFGCRDARKSPGVRSRPSGKLARRMRARNATLLLPYFQVSQPSRAARRRNPSRLRATALPGARGSVKRGGAYVALNPLARRAGRILTRRPTPTRRLTAAGATRKKAGDACSFSGLAGHLTWHCTKTDNDGDCIEKILTCTI